MIPTATGALLLELAARPIGLWRALWSGTCRPCDEVVEIDEVRLLAAAYFWQDPRTAPSPGGTTRRAAARPGDHHLR